MSARLDRSRGLGRRVDLSFAFWNIFPMSSFALSQFLPVSLTIPLPWVSLLGRGTPLLKPFPQIGGKWEATAV